MNASAVTHSQLIREYIAAVENGACGPALARFYTQDAEQVEFPNRLNPNGGRSDLSELLRRAEQVPDLIQRQKFEIRSLIAEGDAVSLEATWTAVLAVPFSTLAAGSEMKAHFAIFFELRDGRIHRQRNYDCFLPW